jgi:hypothetical protein
VLSTLAIIYFVISYYSHLVTSSWVQFVHVLVSFYSAAGRHSTAGFRDEF